MATKTQREPSFVKAPVSEVPENEVVEVDIPADVLGSLKEVVHSFSPEGFFLYYFLATSRKVPEHIVPWVVDAFAGYAVGKNTAIEAFRGSLKTTLFTNYLVVYFIGNFPWKSSMFVQASDKTAKINAKWVANHIKHNQAFKMMFPTVIPDPDRGWGDDGYFVQDTSLEYGEFLDRSGTNPTLFGTGYQSSDKLGKHPTGLFIIDDMNDTKNTRSPRLFAEANAIHDQEMVPMPAVDPHDGQPCWVIYIFTPWVEGDIGDRAKKNPRYVHVRTPVWIEEEPGKPVQPIEPVWPDVFGADRIRELQEDLPPAVFAQMYALDLKAAAGTVLRRGWWHWYPLEEVKDSWPVVIGVDFASVASHQEKHVRGHDYFALVVLAIHPNGKLIFIDGWHGHVTQGEAEDKLRQFCDEYDDRIQVIAIEKLGKGENFANWALNDLPYYIKPQGVNNRGKGERFELQLGPVFRKGKVWVVDDPDHPTIAEGFDEWISWDESERYYDDVLDALWHAVNAAKYSIWPHTPDELIQQERREAEIKAGSNPYPMSAMSFTGE